MVRKTTTTTTTKEIAKVENPDLKKYSKLLGAVDYDYEAAEQLASAINESQELRRRADQLEQIVKENEELHQFLWRTAEGETVALHTVDDDHLANIMMHLTRTGRTISRAVRGEALRRNISIPAKVPVDWNRAEPRRTQFDYDPEAGF